MTLDWQTDGQTASQPTRWVSFVLVNKKMKTKEGEAKQHKKLQEHPTHECYKFQHNNKSSNKINGKQSN